MRTSGRRICVWHVRARRARAARSTGSLGAAASRRGQPRRVLRQRRRVRPVAPRSTTATAAAAVDGHRSRDRDVAKAARVASFASTSSPRFRWWRRQRSGAVKVTCDVGGTFTDVVVSNAPGEVRIGKSLTTPHELISGLLSALRPPRGSGRTPLLERAELFVYSTTQATNAILQGTTARTALLCTEGFPDMLVRREGGSMHPYDFRRPYPDPYIPRHLTFEIRERIGANGEVIVALEEDQALACCRGSRSSRSRPWRSRCCGRCQRRPRATRSANCARELLPGVAVTLSHAAQPGHARVPAGLLRGD